MTQPTNGGRANAPPMDELLVTLDAARALCARVGQSGKTPFVQELHAMMERLAKASNLVRAERASRAEAIDRMRARKDGAFEERDRVVMLAVKLAMAQGLPVGQLPHVGENWGPQWKRLVAIELPTGQVSWHMPESRAYLFDWLPPHARGWDSHDTAVKYQRIDALSPTPAAPGAGPSRLALVRAVSEKGSGP